MTLCQRVVSVAIVVALFAATACKGKDASDKAPPKAVDPEAERVALEPAAAAIEGAVPASLKGKIEFVPVTAAKGDLVVVAPKGWENTAIPDSTRPAAKQSLGFMTTYALGTNCDGTCDRKDLKTWTAIAEKVDMAQLRGNDFSIVTDEAAGGDSDGRLIVAKTTDRTYIVLVRYKDGASHYAYCRAVLDQEVADAQGAFVAACRSLKVLHWD